MQRMQNKQNVSWSSFIYGSKVQLAIYLLIFIIAISARLLPGTRTIDDSFITYRYARNILAGNGFVYNPGEHVLGTTTPLYTILLVTIGALSGGTQAPFPLISLIINALSDGFTCLFLFKLGRRIGSPWAGAGTALVWSIAPYSVTFAIGGLETSLYVLLLTATISAYLDQKYVLAWLAGAFSLLTRPDALILLGPLALDRLVRWVILARRSRQNLFIIAIGKEIGAFILPVSCWIIFATTYFGSPLPHSIAAKSLAYRLPPTAALVRLLQHYATPFLEHLTFGIPWIGIGIVLNIFLFIIGARFAIRKMTAIWPWIAYPILYFVVFSIANPLIFRWYLTPPLPAYFLFILTGAEQILVQIRTHSDPNSRIAILNKRILLNVLPALLIIVSPTVLSLRDWKLRLDHGPDRPAPEMAYIKLELFYQQAAEWLVDELDGSNVLIRLAAGDVGVLGYITDAQILDTVGLNTPVSSEYYPLDPNLYEINYAIPPDLIVNEAPDYLVILEIYGRRGLLKDKRFLENYQLLRKIETDIYGSDGMLIYQRHQ